MHPDHGLHAHPDEREQEEIRQGRGRTGRRCHRGRAPHPRERGTGRTRKKELKPASHKREHRLVKVSRTDPDAGYMYRDQKPEVAHRTVDAKHNFIVDVHVTTGIAKALVELSVFGVITRRHFGGKKGDSVYVPAGRGCLSLSSATAPHLSDDGPSCLSPLCLRPFDLSELPVRVGQIALSAATADCGALVRRRERTPWAPLHLLQGDREGPACQSGSSHRTKLEKASQSVGQKGQTT